MQTLPSSNNSEKSTWLEKIIRIAIPAGLIFGGMKLFNAISPTIIGFLSNVWVMLGLGVPLLVLVLYVLQNPMFIWMTYKNICRKITSFFIKIDFLSYMETYIDILIEKRNNLLATLRNLNAQRIKLEKQVEELKENIEFNIKKASAAKKLGQMEQATHHASIAQGDKESVIAYEPVLERLVRNVTFLEKLENNWGFSIEKLRHEVKRLRTQYENFAEAAKACGQAEEFANGNTEEARVFRTAVDALQESMSQKIAKIEEFERNSKVVMGSIDLEKQMIADDGMKLIEEYEANGTLFLPESYETVSGALGKPSSALDRLMYQQPQVVEAEFDDLIKR